MGPADYTCNPQGVVSGDDVRQIARVPRRVPEIPIGVIGRYDWARSSSRHSRVSCFERLVAKVTCIRGFACVTWLPETA